jgi:hypothetical protein
MQCECEPAVHPVPRNYPIHQGQCVASSLDLLWAYVFWTYVQNVDLWYMTVKWKVSPRLCIQANLWCIALVSESVGRTGCTARGCLLFMRCPLHGSVHQGYKKN